MDKERKIGEIFTLEGEVLKVIEGKDCTGCFFYNTKLARCNNSKTVNYNTLKCNNVIRQDKKGVIFANVETLKEYPKERPLGDIFVDRHSYVLVDKFTVTGCKNCYYHRVDGSCKRTSLAGRCEALYRGTWVKFLAQTKAEIINILKKRDNYLMNDSNKVEEKENPNITNFDTSKVDYLPGSDNSIIDKHVNPDHYKSHPSGVECIEIARHYVFSIGNVFKYIWRAGLKKDEGLSDIDKEIEDLEKAKWYLEDRIKELKEKKECIK